MVGPQLCLSTFARNKRGTTVRKSTYTDMILFCYLKLVSDAQLDLVTNTNIQELLLTPFILHEILGLRSFAL